MAWLDDNNVVQKLGENVFLYDLSRIRGVSAILSRIPDNTSGVYAWYRNLRIDSNVSNNPETFVSQVLQELYKPHCITRETRLPPSHRLIVKPETVFSARKQEALHYHAANPYFRELIISLLHNCILFQQPMYIGKTLNLRSRIGSHLAVESILRERFADAEHDIEQCRLLILCSPQEITCTTSEYIDIEAEHDLESEFSYLEPEALIEDILSRLFLPSFTINYG